MKMSDKFELPLTEGRADTRIGCAWSIGGKAEYIAHAINNHDRLVEENAKLREQLKHSHEWLGINSGYHGSPLCVNNEKLLNQLKGQNNG